MNSPDGIESRRLRVKDSLLTSDVRRCLAMDLQSPELYEAPLAPCRMRDGDELRSHVLIANAANDLFQIHDRAPAIPRVSGNR